MYWTTTQQPAGGTEQFSKEILDSTCASFLRSSIQSSAPCNQYIQTQQQAASPAETIKHKNT